MGTEGGSFAGRSNPTIGDTEWGTARIQGGRSVSRQLVTPLIDLHCHLDLYPDPVGVAAAAAERGAYVLSVTTTPKAFVGTLRLAPKGSRIRTAVGLHPELAHVRNSELPLFEEYLRLTRYVGEVGVDGSAAHREHVDVQASVFMDILLMCAREGGRVLSIHSRGAQRLTLDLLACEPLAGLAILHWFVGSTSEIAQANDQGCWFSVGPAMLASRSGRRAVSLMDKERILPETDGPFGISKGRPLWPWEANNVAQALAEVWVVNEVEANQILTTNFQRFSKQAQGFPPYP